LDLRAFELRDHWSLRDQASRVWNDAPLRGAVFILLEQS
jgi:hypothetical protein